MKNDIVAWVDTHLYKYLPDMTLDGEIVTPEIAAHSVSTRRTEELLRIHGEELRRVRHMEAHGDPTAGVAHDNLWLAIWDSLEDDEVDAYMAASNDDVNEAADAAYDRLNNIGIMRERPEIARTIRGVRIQSIANACRDDFGYVAHRLSDRTATIVPEAYELRTTVWGLLSEAEREAFIMNRYYDALESDEEVEPANTYRMMAMEGVYRAVEAAHCETVGREQAETLRAEAARQREEAAKLEETIAGIDRIAIAEQFSPRLQEAREANPDPDIYPEALVDDIWSKLNGEANALITRHRRTRIETGSFDGDEDAHLSLTKRLFYREIDSIDRYLKSRETFRKEAAETEREEVGARQETETAEESPEDAQARIAAGINKDALRNRFGAQLRNDRHAQARGEGAAATSTSAEEKPEPETLVDQIWLTLEQSERDALTAIHGGDKEAKNALVEEIDTLDRDHEIFELTATTSNIKKDEIVARFYDRLKYVLWASIENDQAKTLSAEVWSGLSDEQRNAVIMSAYYAIPESRKEEWSEDSWGAFCDDIQTRFFAEICLLSEQKSVKDIAKFLGSSEIIRGARWFSGRLRQCRWRSIIDDEESLDYEYLEVILEREREIDQLRRDIWDALSDEEEAIMLAAYPNRVSDAQIALYNALNAIDIADERQEIAKAFEDMDYDERVRILAEAHEDQFDDLRVQEARGALGAPGIIGALTTILWQEFTKLRPNTVFTILANSYYAQENYEGPWSAHASGVQRTLFNDVRNVVQQNFINNLHSARMNELAARYNNDLAWIIRRRDMRYGQGASQNPQEEQRIEAERIRLRDLLWNDLEIDEQAALLAESESDLNAAREALYRRVEAISRQNQISESARIVTNMDIDGLAGQFHDRLRAARAPLEQEESLDYEYLELILERDRQIAQLRNDIWNALSLDQSFAFLMSRFADLGIPALTPPANWESHRQHATRALFGLVDTADVRRAQRDLVSTERRRRGRTRITGETTPPAEEAAPEEEEIASTSTTSENSENAITLSGEDVANGDETEAFIRAIIAGDRATALFNSRELSDPSVTLDRDARNTSFIRALRERAQAFSDGFDVIILDDNRGALSADLVLYPGKNNNVVYVTSRYIEALDFIYDAIDEDYLSDILIDIVVEGLAREHAYICGESGGDLDWQYPIARFRMLTQYVDRYSRLSGASRAPIAGLITNFIELCHYYDGIFNKTERDGVSADTLSGIQEIHDTSVIFDVPTDGTVKEENITRARELLQGIIQDSTSDPQEDSTLFIQPDDLLHSTIEIIGGRYGKEPIGHTVVAERMAKFGTVVEGATPFTIELIGLNITPAGDIVLQGYPKDDIPDRLREKLRDAFGQEGKYAKDIIHISLGRIRKPLDESVFKSLIAAIRSMRNVHFGTIKVSELYLAYMLDNMGYQKNRLIVADLVTGNVTMHTEPPRRPDQAGTSTAFDAEELYGKKDLVLALDELRASMARHAERMSRTAETRLSDWERENLLALHPEYAGKAENINKAHNAGVSVFAPAIARALGMKPECVDTLAKVGAVHDLGGYDAPMDENLIPFRENIQGLARTYNFPILKSRAVILNALDAIIEERPELAEFRLENDDQYYISGAYVLAAAHALDGHPITEHQMLSLICEMSHERYSVEMLAQHGISVTPAERFLFAYHQQHVPNVAELVAAADGSEFTPNELKLMLDILVFSDVFENGNNSKRLLLLRGIERQTLEETFVNIFDKFFGNKGLDERPRLAMLSLLAERDSIVLEALEGTRRSSEFADNALTDEEFVYAINNAPALFFDEGEEFSGMPDNRMRLEIKKYKAPNTFSAPSGENRQEVLYIDEGKVSVEIFDDARRSIKTVIVKAGDTITCYEGYNATVIEDSIITRMIQADDLDTRVSPEEVPNKFGLKGVGVTVSPHDGRILSIVLRAEADAPAYRVVTPIAPGEADTAQSAFGIGTKTTEAGTPGRPHVHTGVEAPTPELLIIRDGELEYKVYSPDGRLLFTRTLKAGQKVLSLAGHDVEFPSHSGKMVEVAVGPYPGFAKAKVMFDQKGEKREAFESMVASEASLREAVTSGEFQKLVPEWGAENEQTMKVGAAIEEPGLVPAEMPALERNVLNAAWSLGNLGNAMVTHRVLSRLGYSLVDTWRISRLVNNYNILSSIAEGSRELATEKLVDFADNVSPEDMRILTIISVAHVSESAQEVISNVVPRLEGVIATRGQREAHHTAMKDLLAYAESKRPATEDVDAGTSTATASYGGVSLDSNSMFYDDLETQVWQDEAGEESAKVLIGVDRAVSPKMQ
ncbi:MAG: hypothetical protein ABH875_07400, partial [Candidatus Omnitrophota bacterium]